MFLAIPESRREIEITAMMASQEILDLRNHGGEETFAERLARKSNPVTDSPETHEEQNTLFTIAINKTIINSWQLRDIYTINIIRYG